MSTQCNKCNSIFKTAIALKRHKCNNISLLFNENSIQLNSLLSKNDRQDNGIYFTPKNVRNVIFDTLKSIHFTPTDILEPSFGSAEFISDCINNYPNANIHGVEKNKIIYDYVIEHNQYSNKVSLVNDDFLEYKSSEMDLIIGNPPYFVTKIKNKDCMTGRGNIFVLFIYKCLTEHLKTDGILAFVLPTSFYNCVYYEPCRKYIANYCSIIHCENMYNVNYYDTNQDTMILIIQKNRDNIEQFILSLNDHYYITPNYLELKQILVNTKTLSQLGFRVKTGEVVWNEHKDKLDDNEGTLVIYTSNIVDNELVLNNLSGQKKQYIKDFRCNPTKGPAILLSRGYGNKYKFDYVFIDDNCEFYGENHINVIYPINDEAKNNIAIIKKSLDDTRTNDFIRMFIGNGAISKTELENVFPIFID